MKLAVSHTAPPWLFDALRQIENAFKGQQPAPFVLKNYTVAELPDPASWTYGLIVVTDEAGGEVPAWSTGTNWRRVTDRAIVS